MPDKNTCNCRKLHTDDVTADVTNALLNNFVRIVYRTGASLFYYPGLLISDGR